MSASPSFINGADKSLAVILSFLGPELTDSDRAFFREANPFGFILFARNCESPEQLRALTNDLKETVGRHCPVVVDQEGGPVQRLKPPVWRAYDPARTFGAKAEEDMEQALTDIRFRTLQIAEELIECNLNVNCDPVLDISMPETHEAIGDRAFSSDPDIIARLGIAVCHHYLAAGITPVIKHLPGQGRAAQDSHFDAPLVETPLEELKSLDFKPFRDVCASDVGEGIWGMVAHIAYDEVDPQNPASASPAAIKDIIRDDIGFKGLLISDAVEMGAMEPYGDMADRCEAVLEAGCDIALHCSGELDEMEKIAESVPKLSSRAQESLQKAEEFRTLAA